MKNNLMTRDSFREAVFQRDGYKCVNCKNPGQDAHHILERRLWADGGYYLDNGATLCGECHIQAEATNLSCEEIREKSGILRAILPEHLYRDQRYDKWGNIFLTNGLRVPGELYYDESVQKILKQYNKLSEFTHYIKYPRSFHCPWSGYIGDDDKINNDLSLFDDEIVVTEKLDGENTTLYSDYCHARSIDAKSHWTQSWVRQLHSQIAHEIPEHWRVCGENLFAKHSIGYEKLKSYFYMFSIWNKNECLSWKDTSEWSQLLELELVPVIFSGRWKEKPEKIHKLWDDNFDSKKSEGYVIRTAKQFNYFDFRRCVMKYVRDNHVTSDSHWKFKNIEKNILEK